MTKKQTLIYLAGFFDGEGCITFGKDARQDRTYRLRVVVTQLNPLPIKMFKDYFQVGLVYKHIFQEQRTQFLYEVKGNKAVPVLEELLPYLIVKKKEAELAINFYKLPWRGAGKRRNERQKEFDGLIFRKVKDLKKKGR